MKNIYLSLLLVFAFAFLANSQKKDTPSLISRSRLSESNLSQLDKNQLEKLKNLDYLNSVTLIDIVNIDDLMGRDEISITIPGLDKNIVSRKIMGQRNSEASMWIGEGENSQIVLSSTKGEVSGHISTGNQSFEIQHLPDGQAILLDYDMEKINLLECEQPHSMSKDSNSKENDFKPTTKVSSETGDQNNRIANTSAVVRVLFLFTPAAANSGQNLVNMANTALAQWQTAVINSNTLVALDLAGVLPLNFNESNDIVFDVNALTNNINAQQLRDNNEADIVMLLTDSQNYGTVAGRVSEIGPLEPNAYGISQISAGIANYTIVHEIGHLLGARHDNDPTPGDAHAHLWISGSFPRRNHWRSIMGVQPQFGPNYTRVLHFSNPFRTHNGEPTGVVNVSNNNRNINLNGPTVEAFRFSIPALWASILGPGTAGNGQTLNFSPNIQGGIAPYSTSWQLNNGSGYYFAGNGTTLTTTMPTNQNLEVMLVVTDQNNSTFTAYRTVQNDFLGGGCTVCPDLGDLEDVGENLNNDVILFPNPTSDKITIKSSDRGDGFYFFEVTDVKNRTIVTSEISVESQNERRITLSVDKLKPGVYLFSYQNSLNEIIHLRFIKN